jgi:hypothetical protein
MLVAASTDENPQPRRLRDVLRQFEGMSEEQIKEFFAVTDPWTSSKR